MIPHRNNSFREHVHTLEAPLEGGTSRRELCVVSGSSHRHLAELVASHFGIELLPTICEKFSNTECRVEVLSNVRQRDVFVVQTGGYSATGTVNDHLMELLILVDACRRAAASSITVVMPCFPYGRQDKKDRPRAPLSARLVANLLETSGSLPLHSGTILLHRFLPRCMDIIRVTWRRSVIHPRKRADTQYLAPPSQPSCSDSLPRSGKSHDLTAKKKYSTTLAQKKITPKFFLHPSYIFHHQCNQRGLLPPPQRTTHTYRNGSLAWPFENTGSRSSLENSCTWTLEHAIPRTQYSSYLELLSCAFVGLDIYCEISAKT